MAPSVTVLMSVYNGERWLSESIQSVLDQTFADFEFIIVNDGSIDQSLQIINQYAEQDLRVRLFDKPNTGLADSLNYGIARAKGVWIARQDADDVSEPDRLRKQWEFAQSIHGVVLIGSGFVLMEEEGKVGRKYTLPRNHMRLKRWLISGKRFFPHSSAFFNRDIVQKIGGYRPRIQRAQDRDLWLRLVESGTVVCVDETLVKIRRHAKQISHDEDGYRQFLYSNVAMVSYWLRRLAVLDPVEEDERTFNDFIQWINEECHKKKLFELVQDTKALKRELSSGWSSASHVVAMIMHGRILSIMRVIWTRYFRSELSKSLAKKYIATRRKAL